MSAHPAEARCPCGTGEIYGACCGRFHSGAAAAPTAEALLRSRFTAFALNLPQYLLDTWHPRTRPASLSLGPEVRWVRLDVLSTSGGPFDDAAHVRFAAHYRTAAAGGARGVAGVQEEESAFRREGGRWYYVDER